MKHIMSQILKQLIRDYNTCAHAKNNLDLLQKEDFIEYANMKDQTK